ncbi:MAG: hypothetical protein ABDH16_02400 [Thermodesulfovibrionaceae bacterium]
MNTDIRIKTTFPNHIKTQMLIKRIGKDGVFSLICLWCYCAVNHPKGDISNLSNEKIAIASQWDKNPDDFVNALIEVGFIDESIDENGNIKRVLHDWQEHNRYVYFAPERSEIARKNAQKRWNKKLEKSISYANCMPTVCQQNTDGMQTACNWYAPSPIPIPSPIPNPHPNNKEKNNISIDSHAFNDENQQKNSDKNCTQLTEVNFVPSNSKNKDSEIYFDGISFKGIEKYIDKWKEAYPLVDIDNEIKQMEAWILAQPRTRWKKDWKRFITNWLSREQDKREMRTATAIKRGFLDD